MSRLDELHRLLMKHQWADTAYGGYGSTARMCPECKGIAIGQSLNNGGGHYTYGRGHTEDCAIWRALDNRQDETSETKEIVDG